ncbi:zinc finger protein 292a [Aplochiton taeniatus]
MAEGETEKEYDTRKAIEVLRKRFLDLTTTLKESVDYPLEASLHFCQEFCQVLVEHAGRWKSDEDPLPLLEVYTVAILSYAKATSCLSTECENVPLLLEKLALSCLELLFLLPEKVPGALWEEFQSSVKLAHSLLQENGNMQLHMLSAIAQGSGVWSNPTLSSILSNEIPEVDRVHEFLNSEGPTLLCMRIKHLIKVDCAEKAAVLAKICSEYPGYEVKSNFRQTYLVCTCMTKTQEQLMEEIEQVDCKDALEMICNLESEGNEKGALCLCSSFLKRQLLQGDVYCAWELTLFWSKLLIRLETSADGFLDHCRNMALLARSVCHILFLIKVIQSEVEEVGLPVCIEMCIQALKMASSDNKDSKLTICKTIHCLLPTDLEVKRACQLTEFLLQPTVDSYYAVESLYNEPDQKPGEEENLPVPNSLRCELLLALKTQWPFDPEFWDWRTLKRNCLALMGEEASIVSSIDTLNDTDEHEDDAILEKVPEFRDLEDFLLNTTNELNEISDEKEKNRETKKLREQGFVSARFRNWRAYMQYCVLCDKEFLGHRIVRHAQKHFKDGVYLCPICADSFESREVLEPHVASHVKQSCKERLAAMKTIRKVGKPPQAPKSPKSSKVQSKSNSPVKSDSSYGDNTNVDLPVKPSAPMPEAEITDDCSCPVTGCSKVFKFFRNLMCHVRSHKNDDEATRFLEIQRQKVVCQYCRRQFVNVKHLNDHLQMHCGTKPYICIQLNCTANFNSNSELLMHRKTHTEFKAQCMFPNCEKIFNEAYLLYDHEAQHYLTFTCEMANCGKIFYSHSEFKLHQANHDPNFGAIKTETLSAPKIGASPQGSPLKEERGSAFVRLERINAEEYMKEGTMKSSTSAAKSLDVPEEPIAVRVKHSIESMLNSAGNPVTGELLKCYTPHSNPPLEQVDGKPGPSDPLQQRNVVAKNDNPSLYPCSTNHVGNQMRVGQDNGVHNVSEKVLPRIIHPSEIKTENQCSQQEYPNTPAAAVSDENLHCCPSQDCTRSYSTNKSLSRHVKKQHPNIFEEWKLSKKYKKVVNIAGKKSSALGKASASLTQPSHQLPPLCNNPGLQQVDYPMVCPISPAPCYPVSLDSVPITPMMNPTPYPPWGSPPNPTELMQPDMPQAWSSPSVNNCYPDAFQVNEYPPRSFPHWQSEPYPTTTPLPSERDGDHSMAAIHGGSMSHVTSESSLMSQYVSSSLMLDNGGQMHNGGHQYGLAHPEMNADAAVSLTRKGNENITSQSANCNNQPTVESLPVGGYHTPYGENVISSPNSRPSIDVPVKSISPVAQIAKTAMEMIKIENVKPGYDQVDNSVDDGLSSHSVINKDFPYEEDSTHAGSEATPTEEKSVETETQKGKKSRQSKRTKWPAIIKDGKVICRRCFREFTSTKSLGGHLSKRSQCKPLEEVDLTADLPTSFLDFLNDPNVLDNNATLFNMSNGDFPQENTMSTDNSVKMMKLEPQSTLISYSSNTFPALVSSGSQAKDGSETNSGHPKTTVETSGVPCQEDNLMEIQNAFQKLDLVEVAHEKILVNISSEQNAGQTNSVLNIDQLKAQKMKERKEERLKAPKPFKCDQDDCEYAFMTKEALFKHLSRMHDFSNEMIEELKKNPQKFSPYPCKICPKTFTRTTGLRIHYEKVHRLSKVEMQKLKIGARNRRVFRLNDTELNNSRATRSSIGIPYIKQEPLDIAIGCQMESSEEEGGPTSPKITSAPNPETMENVATVDLAQLSQTNQRLDMLTGKLASPLKLDSAPKEQAVSTHSSVDCVPELNQNPSQVETMTHVVELLSNQSVPSSPVKPTSSKTTPSKDDGQKKEKPMKRLGLKMCDADNSFSPYRPYRCVHEGCTAAFTIQQNLILHYRAMHQSSLPQSKGEPEAQTESVTSEQEGASDDKEVRCQVKDCSRVFLGYTRLVQHYLLLHKFTRDKATAMMASLNVGTFHCDRSECALPFDSVEKYIEHIKNYHKEIAISESGTVDQTFKCEHEGCDRVYTTKSNLLRHLMKKHDFVCDPKAHIDGRKKAAVGNPNNGKENIESKLKKNKKNIKKKDCKLLEHWTSFGKPTLKTLEEASAMCVKKSSLQYPCMIIGCDKVERAERNIFKHYTTHGLTERYIEDQRSQFIFCKKYSRSRFKDANKSEGMSSSSSSEETEPEESETESTKANGQAEGTLEGVTHDDAKLSNDESSESQASTGEGKKKGRPRKPQIATPACPERMLTLRNRSTVNSSRENSNPGTPAPSELQTEEGLVPESLKPLGLENSLLKFLETSDSSPTSKRKLSDNSGAELQVKRQRTLQQKTVNIMSKIPNELGDFENLVEFRNPLNLKSIKNVKIVMDKTFSDGADLLLKQLQDMRPMVVIKKWLYS